MTVFNKCHPSIHGTKKEGRESIAFRWDKTPDQDDENVKGLYEIVDNQKFYLGGRYVKQHSISQLQDLKVYKASNDKSNPIVQFDIPYLGSTVRFEVSKYYLMLSIGGKQLARFNPSQHSISHVVYMEKKLTLNPGETSIQFDYDNALKIHTAYVREVGSAVHRGLFFATDTWAENVISVRVDSARSDAVPVRIGCSAIVSNKQGIPYPPLR